MTLIFNLYRNYKPLGFFAILSLILFIIDLIIVIPAVFIPYFETGLVNRMPTLIASGFILIVSLLSLMSGIILDSIRVNERREFEFRLMTTYLTKKDK